MLIQLPPNVHRIEIIHEEGLARIVLPGGRTENALPPQHTASPASPRRPRFRPDRNTALLAALAAIAFLMGHVLRGQPSGAAATPTYAQASVMDNSMQAPAYAGPSQHRVVRATPPAADDFGLH